MTATVTAAVVVAAGRGERLGGAVPKAFRPVGGVPLVVRAVVAMAGAVDLVVVAVPPDLVSRTEALLVGQHGGARLRVVEGGQSRADSVARGLEALPPSVAVVLVHDAARALAPASLAESVVAAVRSGLDAVVPGAPVADTVRRVDGCTAVETLDRSALRAIQTPQGFRRALLEQAYDAADSRAVTDDAGLVEQLGVAVTVIEGSPRAFKVTTQLDLMLAEAVLAEGAHG